MLALLVVLALIAPRPAQELLSPRKLKSFSVQPVLPVHLFSMISGQDPIQDTVLTVGIRRTFRIDIQIFNALVALETGVIKDERLYCVDGTVYPVKEWNHDHSLASGFKASAVGSIRSLPVASEQNGCNGILILPATATGGWAALSTASGWVGDTHHAAGAGRLPRSASARFLAVLTRDNATGQGDHDRGANTGVSPPRKNGRTGDGGVRPVGMWDMWSERMACTSLRRSWISGTKRMCRRGWR